MVDRTGSQLTFVSLFAFFAFESVLTPEGYLDKALHSSGQDFGNGLEILFSRLREGNLPKSHS